MTKEEFFSKIPNSIEHRTWGYGELEVVVDRKGLKGVCYRHPSKLASFGTYKPTWSELYDNLSAFMIENGYMKKID